jgi:hypothetical protein
MLSAVSKRICWRVRGRSPLHTRAAVAASGRCSRVTRTICWVIADRGSRISLGRLPAMTLGPVSTAVGRSAVAAKARFICSECRSGGSLNSKRGSTPCKTRVQAS